MSSEGMAALQDDGVRGSLQLSATQHNYQEHADIKDTSFNLPTEANIAHAVDN